MSEPTEAEKLAAALEEIKKLQTRIWSANSTCDSLRSALEREQAFSKKVGDENTELRNKIMGVRRVYGPDGERLCISLEVQRYFAFPAEQRDEWLTEVVIDGVRMLLRHATRSAHLETLRKKVGA